MEQGAPKEDKLLGAAQTKSQDVASVHTQTEDMGSTPTTSELDLGSKAPRQSEGSGMVHLKTNVGFSEKGKDLYISLKREREGNIYQHSIPEEIVQVLDS